MPLIEKSSFRPLPVFRNGHLQTILPALFRKTFPVDFKRERLELPDGDFLDLDWYLTGSPKLLILSHGLEGSTNTGYTYGMARAFAEEGWDVLSWNARGCSGEPNRLLRFYHCGNSPDLKLVLDYVLQHRKYAEVLLAGFSMGGNITLKLLGEMAGQTPEQVIGAIVFSTPCHLKDSAVELQKPSRKIYLNRFLKSLRKKILQKNQMLPGELDISQLKEIRNFFEFDNLYTAPLHGFSSADDYYEKSSSVYYLSGIQRPVLIVNALNDPFLGGRCYPLKEAESSPFVYLEMPESGGHVGFFERSVNEKRYWSEKRALAFASEITGKRAT